MLPPDFVARLPCSPQLALSASRWYGYLWPLVFIRWLFCRRNFKRSLFGLACFVTLIALLYAEEDWRGKHDWENFKHEWEAKGEKFDRASVVPPLVPDEQNFALTPLVASSYETFLDKNGHFVWPRNTNVVNRMEMRPYGDDSLLELPTNGDWRTAKSRRLERLATILPRPGSQNECVSRCAPAAIAGRRRVARVEQIRFDD